MKEAQNSKKSRHADDTNKRGISKTKQQQFKQRRSRKKGIPNEEKRTRAIIEELRREQATDKTEDNLKMFQKLSKSCPKFSMEQLHTRMHRTDGEASQSKPEKSSVFTDEDFRRFEEEYHIS